MIQVRCSSLLRFNPAIVGHPYWTRPACRGVVVGKLDALFLAKAVPIEMGCSKKIELYDNTTSLQDRTATTAIVSAELACSFGAGGYVGRASGRNFDARRYLATGPMRLSRSTFRCEPTATSMHASGSGLARSSNRSA